MRGRLRQWERAIRAGRDAVVGRIFSGRRGRKLALDALAGNVTALTIDGGDHVMSFSPHELVGRHIYTRGHFDRDRVDDLLAILDDEGLLPGHGAIVLDIGANIGTQTVYFGISGKVGRVIAIEPDPRNLTLLRRNVAENDLTHMTTIVPVAVGDFEGTAELFRKKGNHGQSSLIAQEHDEPSVQIVVRPLAMILADAEVDPADVAVVWMDIQGAEPMACRSMTALLARRAPLMMEFSPDLYGLAGTRDFIAFLAGFYDRCIVFDRNGRRAATPADLPLAGKQVDVLFLP